MLCRRERINKLLSIIYVIIVIVPYTNRQYLGAAVILAVLWGLSIVPAIVKKNGIEDLRVNKAFVYLFLWFITIILLRLIGYSTAEWGNYAKQILYWIPLIMFYYYNEKKDLQHLRRLSMVVIIVVISVVFDNIRLNELYPGVIEVITSPFFSRYWDQNFAFTTFFFISGINLLILIYIYNFIKNKLIKLILMVSSLAIMYLIYVSGRATAFILTVLSIPFIVSIKMVGKVSSKLKIIYSTLIVISIFIMIIIVNENIESIVSYISNERLKVRILSVFNAEGGDINTLSRLALIRMSIETWLKNILTFFIGIGFHQVSDSRLIGVGQHSGFVDLLGYYGVMGLFINIKIYRHYYKYFTNYIPIKTDKSIAKLVFAVIMIYNILNNIVSLEMGPIIFLLVPSFYLLMSRRRTEDIEGGSYEDFDNFKRSNTSYWW